MVILRRIGVRSAGKVGFWLGVTLATINVVIFFIFLAFVLQKMPPAEFFVRAIVFTFFTGVQTALILGGVAFLYNIIARNHGGLELDFEMPSPPTNGEKRKNDDLIGAEDDSDDESTADKVDII